MNQLLCSFVNMKKILFVFGMIVICSCHNGQNELPIPDLSDKELQAIKDLKTVYKAEDVKYSKLDMSGGIVDKSILIEILNSKVVKQTDTNFENTCGEILFEFVKSYQPLHRYDMISIKFTEGTDIIIAQHSKGVEKIYGIEEIKDIEKKINSIDYIAQQKLKEYENNKDYDEVIKYTKRLLLEYPKEDILICHQALAYYYLHDTLTAINLLLKSREIDSTYIDYPLDLAIIYEKQGKYDLSLKYIDSILLLNSNYPKAFYYRGLINYNKGNKTKGCEDMKIASDAGFKDAATFLLENCK